MDLFTSRAYYVSTFTNRVMMYMCISTWHDSSDTAALMDDDPGGPETTLPYERCRSIYPGAALTTILPKLAYLRFAAHTSDRKEAVSER